MVVLVPGSCHFYRVSFFAADFGNFSYNKTRLDAGAMNFAEDPGISMQMMFQTYPMVWMILGLLVAVLLFRWMYQQSHWRVINRTDGKGIPYKRKYFIITAILFVALIYGSFTWPPLGRNDSFRFRDSFKSYVAINPLQNFFSTLHLRRPEFHEQKARAAFPLMAEMMQLPPSKNFTYRRRPCRAAMHWKAVLILYWCNANPSACIKAA